ncbi:transmembrane 4 L6 family member 18 [Octodon degus]|uniref:Transmembrane 4 L6 family member 18 n=1 Tax=Octodon degus TaxID=10160 RepID=A0A6P6F359_OCTDE|nr:transmembrane 4 L6 family member 18 [Octodon degus]
MGSWKCGGCLSCLLIPLALWSIIVNILLYFPNGQTFRVSSNKLTNYVWYFEGLCFSGVMMLIVAVVLLVLDSDNRYKCCQSENCSKKYMDILENSSEHWFSDCELLPVLFVMEMAFLTNSSIWSLCLEPAHVVEWNVILFSILITLSGLQVIVCLIRVILQLSKMLCETYSVIIQPGII